VGSVKVHRGLWSETALLPAHLYYMCLSVFVVGECRKVMGDFYFILFIPCIVDNRVLC
jgi:hypothetical protein